MTSIIETLKLVIPCDIYNIDVTWDDEFKSLDYAQEPFNDSGDFRRWLTQGYQPKICGDLADMRKRQPSWNTGIVEVFQRKGWKDIGTSYYRMTTGTVMPVHEDRYVRYIDIFNLQGLEHNIRRAIVLLEDWCPGHYFEIMGEPLVKWKDAECA